jgi:hypothetical protein
MLFYVFVFILVILAMISMYLAGLLGGVPYAYKVFTAKKYNHYTCYKQGHVKVLRKNKKLVRDQAFRDAMKIFQGDVVDDHIIEHRFIIQERVVGTGMVENTVQVVKNILANVSASCEDLVPSEYRQRGALLNTREHRPLYDDLLKAEDPNGQVTTKLTECVGYTPIDPSSSTPMSSSSTPMSSSSTPMSSSSTPMSSSSTPMSSSSTPMSSSY